MNRLSGKKILAVSLALLVHLVYRGPGLIEYRQRPHTRPDFASASDRTI